MTVSADDRAGAKLAETAFILDAEVSCVAEDRAASEMSSFASNVRSDDSAESANPLPRASAAGLSATAGVASSISTGALGESFSIKGVLDDSPSFEAAESTAPAALSVSAGTDFGVVEVPSLDDSDGFSFSDEGVIAASSEMADVSSEVETGSVISSANAGATAKSIMIVTKTIANTIFTHVAVLPIKLHSCSLQPETLRMRSHVAFHRENLGLRIICQFIHEAH